MTDDDRARQLAELHRKGRIFADKRTKKLRSRKAKREDAIKKSREND